MLYVIGSGPAGVSCATALLARGEEVTMLDAGFTLEPETAAVVQRLAGQPREAWDRDAIKRMKVLATVGGVPRKLVYGSDYAYRQPDAFPALRGRGVDFSPSFAMGGLSNVWGAAMLPYLQSDIDGWPITVADLAPYYPKVLEFVPLAAREDGLASLFPLYTDKHRDHRSSAQARRLLDALARHERDLAGDGMRFGSSRLAVSVTRDSGEGCVYCGLCMFGCPYGLIYHSAQTLSALTQHPKFRYTGGIVVQRLEERADGVVVHGRSAGGEAVSFGAERVFVACGAVPTTKLAMDAAGVDETTMRDSQYFLLPLLQAAGSDARNEDLHTLAQVFIEVRDPGISERTVHLQVYTYNDVYDLEFRRRFGRLYSFLPVGAMLDRMTLVQGFLHSDDSVPVTVRRRDGGLRLVKGENPRTRGVISRVVRKLARNSLRFGAGPLVPMLQVEQPGKSFHFGGTFPMRADPGPGESDTLGRPAGLERVHLVDSSVLPSIPATTITFSVMANAYRIASEYR